MKTAKLILVATLVGMATAAHADLWYTFDSSASPINGAGFNGGTFAWNSTYQAVQQTAAAGGWTMGGAGPKFEFGWPEQVTMQGIAASGQGRIGFDLRASQTASFNLGGWVDWDWYQLHFAGNSDGAHGWTQDPVYGPNPVGTNYHPNDPDLSWHFDLSFAELGWDAGDQWFQLFFGSNSDGARPMQFLIDNIHVYQVPEPSSLALLGLGVAAVVVRRRK